MKSQPQDPLAAISIASFFMLTKDKVEVYIHFIWVTWDRLPLISPELEPGLYRVMGEIASRHKTRVLAIGGVADHVHLLLKLRSINSVAELAKDIKGASSRFANDFLPLHNFKWRPTYAAFSVSRWDVAKLIAYIQNQKRHHAENTIKPELEPDDEQR